MEETKSHHTIIKVEHWLEYTYSQPVWLEPHVLTLFPRQDSLISVQEYFLTILPKPVRLVPIIDAEGNLQQVAFFDEITQYLRIESNAVVQNLCTNPFDYTLYPGEATHIPFSYSATEQLLLVHYLNLEESLPVKQLATKIANDSNFQTIVFLLNVVRYIQEYFAFEYREFGEPLLPAQTIERKQGSCRDLACLMVGLCQAVGIAARFVSGYCLGDPNQPHTLHAWVEVYLPAAGWRGFDPTLGIAIGQNHIPLGASAASRQVSPVVGTFRGTAEAYFQAGVSVL